MNFDWIKEKGLINYQDLDCIQSMVKAVETIMRARSSVHFPSLSSREMLMLSTCFLRNKKKK
jgi:hypothetical protein